jgi:DNA-binding IclR family transcriptional regulator
MTEVTTGRDGSVKSVERSIDVLFVLSEHPMTLTEVSTRTALSKSTALRLLTTLAHGGLVVKDPLTGNYQLGAGCLKLGQGFVSGQGGFAALAHEPLQTLWEETGETVTVHVRLGNQRVCVDEIPSPHGVRYVSPIGATAPVYLGSAGRVLLAWLPKTDLNLLIEGVPLFSPASGTYMDEKKYLNELDLVRRRRYAMSSGERIAGGSAISVPITGPSGVVASLSILGPSSRLTQQARLAALPRLNEAAAQMSRSLVV